MEKNISPKIGIDNSHIFFSAKEISELRDVLRISLGRQVDELSDEDVSDLGSTMLRVTAIFFKAKHIRNKTTPKVK